MKRIFFLLATLCVVVSCFVFSVGATSISFLDYNDYLINVTASGANDICTWQLPLSMYYCDIYCDDTKTYIARYDGNSMTAYLEKGKSYRITFYSPYLILDNIPDDTRIWVEFDMDRSVSDGNNFAYLNVGSSYFNKDGQFIKQINGAGQNIPIGGDSDGMYYDDVIKRNVVGAHGVQIFYQFNGYIPEHNAYVTYSLESSIFEASISSAYRAYAESQKTNKLIDEVNKQLEANGEKMDEIINGDASAEAPAGSDKVNDFLEVEEELLDQTQDGFDQADILFNQAPGIIMLYASAFLFVSNVLEKIALAGWLQNILTISVSIGLIGFILNLTATALRNSGRGGGKS